MIEVADKMNRLQELGKTDSYFYVDDSVVFARNIDSKRFEELIDKLNEVITDNVSEWTIEPILDKAYAENAFSLKYKVEFHRDDKSSICNIEDSFKGMSGLFLMQRSVSMGGWIKGNIDEVDDNVALKKLTALQEVVDNQIELIKDYIGENKESEEFETRLKWLKRYRRYFLFRKKRLEILLNGEFDKKLLDDFMKKFKIREIVGLNHKEKILTDGPTRNLLEELFEIFEEDIFKSEFELIAQDMSSEEKASFCDTISAYDETLSLLNNTPRNHNYLY